MAVGGDEMRYFPPTLAWELPNCTVDEREDGRCEMKEGWGPTDKRMQRKRKRKAKKDQTMNNNNGSELS